MVLDMTAPLNTSRSPSPSRARCFCGAPQAPEIEYYCSVKCAREDALNALTLGAPHTSDRPPTPPLPTLPPDFFKPPIVRRGSYRSISSNGSDEGFPYHVDLGPFAALHPRSKPDVVVPRADASMKPGHASCSSTTSSGSDKPRWKSHYRRLREKGSLHSIPDTIQQVFQATSASATDDSIGSSSAASSSSKNKSKLMQKVASGAVRASFRQLAPSAADLDFFDSLPLQNPRKPMSGHLTISSTRVRSTSRQSSTRGASSISSALSPIIPPGLDFATQSPASRHRALGPTFGRSEPSLSVHVTAIETPAALHQDLRAPRDTSRPNESSAIEFDNTAPLECPLPHPPPPKQPLKGGAARMYLPLRRIDSQCSLSSQKPPQRLPFTTDVGLPPSAPTAAQTSTRPGIVVRQGVQLTKRRLPIGGGPTKFSTDLKSGHSRVGGVALFLQCPVKETEVSKLPPLSAIKVEDAPAFDVRSSASTRQRTMAPAFPKTPPPNMASLGASSLSVTPRPNQIPPLQLEGPEQIVSIVHDDGREMDEVSTPSTSECPVTPTDCAFTLGDSQLRPSASVEWSRVKQGMEESDVAIFNLHRRFESGMDLDEVTPIGEKRFVLAAQRQ